MDQAHQEELVKVRVFRQEKASSKYSNGAHLS